MNGAPIFNIDSLQEKLISIISGYKGMNGIYYNA